MGKENGKAVLHKFALENKVGVPPYDSKRVGLFTVTVKLKKFKHTYNNVPVTVSDKGTYGELILEWDEHGLKDYSGYGLFQHYGTGYHDFNFDKGVLTIKSKDMRIKIK